MNVMVYATTGVVLSPGVWYTTFEGSGPWPRRMSALHPVSAPGRSSSSSSDLAKKSTRTDIVEITGMSRSTVDNAVGRLLAEGRVIETEMQAKGPGSGSDYPATGLKAVPSSAPSQAIDFGHNHIHVALVDALGRALGNERGHPRRRPASNRRDGYRR